MPQSGVVTRIREISVARGSDALNIEINGSGPMTAKTMKLTQPDRVVVDIPNSVLQGRSRDIQVNSNDVKAVRAARYQSAPPATRVVVDMAAMGDFEVVPSGNKLVVKLRGGSNSVPAAPRAAATEAVATTSAVSQPVSQPAVQQSAAVPAQVEPRASEIRVSEIKNPEIKTAGAATEQSLVIVAPAFSVKEPGKPEDSKTEDSKTEDTKAAATQSRADQAASHFAGQMATVPSINQPPFAAHASLAAQPAMINAALQQQQQQMAESLAPWQTIR
jgi:hypothetical protein